MRRILPVLIAALLALPLAASAHATPVSYEPASSAVLDTVPKEVTIQFSEHPEQGASAITVTAPSGEVVSRGNPRIAVGDARGLSVDVVASSTGTYVVSWSVVSSDDGHFTKGGYIFAVGSPVDASKDVSSFELVTHNNVSEALGMTLELLGNGFLWAIMLFFAFALRPVLPKFENEKPLLMRLHRRVLFSAVAMAICGALLQLSVKSSDLSELHDVGLWQSFLLYAATSAGAATLWRMAAVASIGVVFALGKKRIFSSPRFTYWEGAIFVLLGIFAFFRAVISHATANPFHPGFSIFVNFLHVIEKDTWAGLIGILLIVVLFPRLRNVASAVVSRTFVMLGFDAAFVGVTACYIVWLHLKSVGHLFTTEWGGAFLNLAVAATVLVAFRTLSVYLRWKRSETFVRRLPALLGAELVFAVLVVYFSSIIIITSPPLDEPSTPVYSATDQGLTITLERDRNEDGMLMLHAGETMPAVTMDDGALSIDLQKRYGGAYVFPAAILGGAAPHTLLVTAPQENAYDAHASFILSQKDFVPAAGWEKSRPLNAFTLTMIIIAALALAYALALAWISGRPVLLAHSSSNAVSGAAGAGALAAAAALILYGTIWSVGAFNPFKAECEGDGNMWHLMLPTKAGVPVSTTAKEGCMWGMGNYVYLFSDRGEYDYYRSLPAAEVSLKTAPAKLVAGVPTAITVSLKNSDGTPATLFVDMEKLLHLVIVSRDQTSFAHIHADDLRPLTPEEIKNSTFTFNYTFPKAGDYLVSADFAHGLTLESKQFPVTVAGYPMQSEQIAQYAASGSFGGYEVALTYSLPIAGSVTTMQYSITKDGKPATDLVPYLSAAMHISVVKDDFGAFLHVHGEVHPPGTLVPPVIVKNGQVVHSMANMVTPAHFGPTVDAHFIFPKAGLYTVWGEFKAGGKVIPTAFTVRVEE